jgi:hypothetical protein
MNARMDIRGFYVWRVANVVLFSLHALSGLWLLCILDIAYFRLNTTGIKKWNVEKSVNTDS